MVGAGLRTATAYPSAIIATAVSGALSLSVLVALWSAIYAQRSGAAVGGYSLAEMSTYLVASNLLAVLLANQADERLAGEIYRGDHVVGMVRPVGYLFSHAALALPYVLVRLTLVAVPLAAGAALILDLNAPRPMSAVLFIVSAALSTLLAIASNLLVGMAGFVTTSTWGVRYLAATLTAFLSGQLVPLAFFPPGFRGIVEALPYAAMISVPVRLLLGDYRGFAGAAELLGTQALWLGLLGVACRYGWRAASAAGTIAGG
jgi:ABC-2 type transport system permease protein